MATENLTLRRRGDGYWATAWVTAGGERKHRTFGKDRQAARRRFAAFRTAWLTDPAIRNPDLVPGCELTIRQAWERYEEHAKAYYRRADGTPTGEANNIGYAMRPVLDLFGDHLAAGFGPKMLRKARDVFVGEGVSRKVCNQYIDKIRRVWRWLAAEELVAATVWHGLRALEPLREGRSEATETAPVNPAPEAYIWAVCDHLPATLKAMVEVQFWSGCRPAEVVAMRPCDLDVSGKVWLYRPPQHKTRHRGRRRVVMLGPKAQLAVKPFLAGRATDAPLFSPREAQRQRWAECETHRHQAVVPSRTMRKVGERYTSTSYGRCIRRVCDDQGIPRWSPGQLRHNAATRLRKQFGLDVAQVILGHSRADVTQVYAEADARKAVSAMERVG